MALTKYCTSPQLTAPAAAAPISITPSATIWANSAWVQVIASTATAIVVTGIQPAVIGTSGVSFEFDVGVGTAGAETVVTTFRGYVQNNSFCGKVPFPMVIPTDNIPAASRVAIRLRKSSTNVAAWTVVLLYWAKPLVGPVLTTAKPQKCAPAAANPVTVTPPGTVWTNSAYVTIIASAAADLVLTGIVLPVLGSGIAGELDVAVGAAGAEVIITSIRVDNTGQADAGFCYPLWNPLDAIPAGSRVSARGRRNYTSGSLSPALVYVEKPL